MRRLGIAALAAVAALAAAPAAAQDPVTVQARTPEGRTVTLTVREGNGLRCLAITHADEGASRTAPCAAPPSNAHEDARALHAVYRSTPERITILYGLVSDGTRELRVRLGDGRLEVIRPDRDAGAYLRVVSGRPAVATVNALDGEGTLRGAADLDPRALEPVRGPFALMRTRDERGRRATVTAFTARVYRDGSTRRSLQACMGIVRRGTPPASNVEPGYAGGSACTASRRRVIVRYSAGCAEKRLLLYGIVPTAITRLRLLTAEGRRHEVALALFPRRLRHPGRAFVFSAVDPGQITRMEAYTRDGSRVASLPLSGVAAGCASSRRS